MASILDYINITKVQGRVTSSGGSYITSEGNYLVDGSKGDFVKFEVLLKESLSFAASSVTIDITSSDISEGIIGKTGTYDNASKQKSLTFTGINWDTPQYFYVIGVDDFDSDGEQGYSINLSINTDKTTEIEYISANNQSALFVNYDDIEDQPYDDYDSGAFGTTGVDYLVGSNSTDFLYGNDGDDSLYGGYGDDFLYGEEGNDRLYGQQGNDKLYGGKHLDRLYGNDGNDKLYGEQGADYLNGGAGNDLLNGGFGADRMLGGAGNDTYVIDNINDEIIDWGSTSDINTVHVVIPSTNLTYILAKNINNANLGVKFVNGNLFGNAEDNVLKGNSGNNRLNGGWGDDRLVGKNGNDIYIVNSSNDVVVETNSKAIGGIDLIKSSASFILSTNVENLTLTGIVNINATGNGLANILKGNHAENIIKGKAGNDLLIGNGGNDTLTAGWGNDRINGGAGNDSIDAGKGNDIVMGGTGADKVNAGAGNDIVNAGSGNDTVNGGIGDDTIVGGAGGDTLIGATGDDVIDGGIGSDILTGGLGADIFKLTSKIGVDNITDFSVGQDVIQLENSVFSSLGINGILSKGKFKIGAKALDNNDYLIYTKATGELFYDADGSGSADAIQIALLGQELSLTHNDFIVI